MRNTVTVLDTEISLVKRNYEDFISLTDIARNTSDGNKLIENWLRNKNTLEFLAAWESLHNPEFNSPEFEGIRSEAGTNRFLMSVHQWVTKTNAIGLVAKSGRFGGTYAHKDIAFEFASWISPLFKLLLIKEYQRLKEAENHSLHSQWDFRRFLSKVNYRLQTDAIKDNILPNYKLLTKEQEAYIYANEAEMLNVAVFGITSKQWRSENKQAVSDGHNIRDLATIPQLTVIANLETLNAHLLKEGISPKDRFVKLKAAAVEQLRSLGGINYAFSIESPHSNKASSSPKNLKRKE